MQTYDLSSLMSIGGFQEPQHSSVGIHGWGIAALYNEDGVLIDADMFSNLITNVGDEYYGERAAGIGTPPAQVTGMRLGTGTTVPNKATQAGLAIVTYVTGSNKAIDGTHPTSNNTQTTNTACRIQWKTTWAAGEATSNGISEVVITNETPLTNVQGAIGNTISRAVLGTVVNKAAGDTLAITWNHDLLGA